MTADPIRVQIGQVLAIVVDVLGDDAIGAYLHGSTGRGRMQPRSDLDVLVVARRATTREEKRRLVDLLVEASNPTDEPGLLRPVELTLVVASDVRPWRYRPRCDFLYGEWLRGDFLAGNLEPWGTAVGGDLAVVLAMVLQANRRVLGPPPADVLDPVPAADVVAAAVEGIDGLLASLDGDTRNVVLTLARIWMTVATGEIGSKDEAADWALPRLPEEHRAVLARARAIYLGDEDERWEDLAPRVRPFADHVVGEVRRFADQPGR